MEPRERARRSRADESSSGDDDRDDLPWLQDEKPSSRRPLTPARPPEPQQAAGRTPWWGRLIGADADKSADKGAAVKRVRPFEGRTDAETVVASRDELLRAVREYMGGRKSPLLDSVSAEAPDDEVAPPPLARVVEAPPVVRRPVPGRPIDDLEEPPAREEPSEPPRKTRELKAAPLRPAAPLPAPLPVRPATPPAAPPVTRPSAPETPAGRGKGDIFDMLESRRAQAGQGPEVSPAEPASEEPPPRPRPRPSDPETPSAMARERVLPTAGRPKRKVERQAPAEPSLSSFSLTEDQPDKDPYPQEFISPGLRHLMTRQWGAALDFYREEARHEPGDAHAWYGQAAAFIAMDRLEDAAPCLVRAHELDPGFPVARLISDVAPDDPVTWYNLAAALVAERNRAAYLCAEVVLTQCLGGADDDQLRGRAQRVQRDIARMLEQRSQRDELQQQEAEPWHAVLRQPAVVAGIVVVVLALLLLWRHFASSPAAPSPASSASLAPASPHVVASPLPKGAETRKR